MPQSINLIKDTVSSLECVNSLDLPARVGEAEPGRFGLNIHTLERLSLQLFDVLVINIHILKLECLVVIIYLKFLLGCESGDIFATLDLLNFFAPIHSLDLASQKVGHWRQYLI